MPHASHKQFESQGKCHFLPGGGLLKIGGDQVLCLRSKGGSKDFFKLKRGGSLIFFKENILLNIDGILVNFTEKVVF